MEYRGVWRSAVGECGDNRDQGKKGLTLRGEVVERAVVSRAINIARKKSQPSHRIIDNQVESIAKCYSKISHF